MAISKVILNGVSQIDLTQDTVAANKLVDGETAHDKAGETVEGSLGTGVVTAPSSISGSSATVSTSGTNTLTLTKTVSVTPNVTTAGVISSGTAGNSNVSLSAAVNIRSSSDMSASGATVTAPAGYYGSDGTKSVASGTVTAPASISGTSASVSTGTNTLTLSKTVSVTPSVTTAGYVSSGTAGNSSVSLTASVTTQGATTITPSTSQQTAVSAGTYCTGAVTVSAMASGTAGTPTATKGIVSNHQVSITPSVTNTTGYITGSTKTGTAVTVTASELASGNKEITSNGSNIDVVGYETVSVSVGGTSKNAQSVTSTSRVTATSLTACSGEITVAKTGTYTVYWGASRSSTSGTWSTRLYVNGVANGTEETTFTNHVQAITHTNVSLTQNDKVRVYAKSRGSNYYAYVPLLSIIET